MVTDQTAATVREWTDVLSRIRFGTIKVAGKNITGARVKAVAGRMANYADSDGTRVRPGLARVAVDLETDYRTVKSAVSVLRRLGLLELVRAGGRPGQADEFRLALPTDLTEQVELWSPARHVLETERVREANRGKYRKPEPDPTYGALWPHQTNNLRGPETPAETRPAGATRPADTAETVGPAGASGTAENRPAGVTGADLRGPQAPATYQDLDTTTTYQHGETFRTAVTGPRATSSKQPDFRIEGQPPRRSRCDHGLVGGNRPDGQPHCALCRREKRPSPADVAKVIQMRPTA